MSSTFPTSDDAFSVPSSPSTTPLSSAGDGTRNHWESHRDQGDAIVAIQQNVAVKSHDHSGIGARATPKLKQVNTHEDPDTNVSNNSIHHTLGLGTFQAMSYPIARSTLDTIYLRKFNVSESIDGVKTFTSSPVITSFTGMNHNHSSALTGGQIVSAEYWDWIAPNQQVPTNTVITVKHQNSFTIPANTKFAGVAYVEIGFASASTQDCFLNVVLGHSSVTTNNLGSDNRTVGSTIAATRSRWPGSTTVGDAFVVRVPVPFLFAATSSDRVGFVPFMTFQAGAGSAPTIYNILIEGRPSVVLT